MRILKEENLTVKFHMLLNAQDWIDNEDIDYSQVPVFPRGRDGGELKKIAPLINKTSSGVCIVLKNKSADNSKNSENQRNNSTRNQSHSGNKGAGVAQRDAKDSQSPTRISNIFKNFTTKPKDRKPVNNSLSSAKTSASAGAITNNTSRASRQSRSKTINTKTLATPPANPVKEKYKLKLPAHIDASIDINFFPCDYNKNDKLSKKVPKAATPDSKNVNSSLTKSSVFAQPWNPATDASGRHIHFNGPSYSQAPKSIPANGPSYSQAKSIPANGPSYSQAKSIQGKASTYSQASSSVMTQAVPFQMADCSNHYACPPIVHTQQQYTPYAWQQQHSASMNGMNGMNGFYNAAAEDMRINSTPYMQPVASMGFPYYQQQHAVQNMKSPLQHSKSAATQGVSEGVQYKMAYQQKQVLHAQPIGLPYKISQQELSMMKIKANNIAAAGLGQIGEPMPPSDTVHPGLQPTNSSVTLNTDSQVEPAVKGAENLSIGKEEKRKMGGNKSVGQKIVLRLGGVETILKTRSASAESKGSIPSKRSNRFNRNHAKSKSNEAEPTK